MKNKCSRNDKNCQCCLIYGCKGGDFICSGINIKPSKYKKDLIKLCLKGRFCSRSIEMTVEEASYICSVLCSTLGNLAPKIIKRQ